MKHDTPIIIIIFVVVEKQFAEKVKEGGERMRGAWFVSALAKIPRKKHKSVGWVLKELK